MRIYIHYKITDEPWGGGNSFLKALKAYLAKQDSVEVVDDIRDSYDIFLFNGGYQGPGEYIDISQIKKIYRPFVFRSPVRFVYRLDGFRAFYGSSMSEMDKIQLKLLPYADRVILQSHYCLDSIHKLGGDIASHTVISNGVDPHIFSLTSQEWHSGEPLKLLACSWSRGVKKGHHCFASLSERQDVQCTFVGNWNEEVDAKNVRRLPPMKQNELAKVYRENHVFVHLSENDYCPNVVIEALSSGLPVLYHQSGGTQEIAQGYGVGVDEMTQEAADQGLETLKEQYLEFAQKIRQDREKFSIETIAAKYLSEFFEIYNKR